MGATQTEISHIGLPKGEGLRIISVRENSPLSGKVLPFFDFIVDAVPSQEPQKTPKQILGKLTNEDDQSKKSKQKTFKQMINDNENSQICLKIVSAKYRNIYNVEITPNRSWGDSNDLIGVILRRQRYDEAFDAFTPFSDIKNNSPVKKAGIEEGEFLIGCKQFKYHSNNEMLENVYDRFYDKETEDKNINLAVYNLRNDDLRMVPVTLQRGWGEKGLLGCQFLQGQLNRFPKNLLQVREQMMNRNMNNENESKIKKELTEGYGISEEIVNKLKSQRVKKKKHLNNLRSILLLEPPKVQVDLVQPNLPNQDSENKEEMISEGDKGQRIRGLETRVLNLERTLGDVKAYLDKILQEQP